MSRLITEKEWAEHRRSAIAIGPDVLAGLPDVFLSYQKTLLETTAAHQVVVVEKSRRTGVTWAAGADAVLTAGSEKSARGMDVLYIGYNLDMAREFIDTCAMWAKTFNSAVTEGGVDEFLFDDGDPDSNIMAFRIRFASGFEITALASRPRSLRGRQGYVIIDEAAFHDDLPGVLQAALALLIWGGKLLIISTHNGESNPYNQLLKDVRGGKKPYAILRVDFDDALKAGIYERICLVTDKTWSVEAEAKWRSDIIAFYGDGADEELFCIPAESGGAWLPAPLIEARTRAEIPILRLAKTNEFTHWPEHLRKAEIEAWCTEHLLPLLKNLDPFLAHYLGGDFGRVSDLTVYWPLAVARDLRRITPFVVELKNLPFDAQQQIQNFIMARLPRFSAADFDATGLGASLAEAAAQRYGRNQLDSDNKKSATGRIAEVKLSTEWYRENMQPLKTAFEDDTISIPRDADIVSDFKLIQVIKGVATVPALKSGVKKDRHGDSCVACALAHSASRRTVLAYDYDSANSRSGSWRGEDAAAQEDDEQIYSKGLH